MTVYPDFRFIICDQADGVAEITLNRPDKLNALGFGPGSNRAELVTALQRADADPEVGAILLRAAGRAFCAGGDLEGLPPAVTPADHLAMGEMLNDFHRAVRETRKPVIAAVHGLCLGAGLGLIAQCDIVLLGDDARLGLVEGRIGAPGAAELVPLIGTAWAKFLMLTGEMIPADQAVKIGLGLATVPAGTLVWQARDLARRIGRLPREAVELNKLSINAISDAMGGSQARLVARGHETLTRSMVPHALAPDGRRFVDILKAEGMRGLKAAQSVQYDNGWLSGLTGMSNAPTPPGGKMRALVIRKNEMGQTAALEDFPEAELMDGDVLVRVSHSSLNYKDGLAITGSPVVRRFPMIPGIDFAGVVETSLHADFKPGDEVLLNGWGTGETHLGAYAEKSRVKGDWLIHLPKGLSPQMAMAIGTAGYTSMLCVQELEAAGLTPDQGPVVVTGAAGGVGSVAVALLARAGWHVIASTGRASEEEYLRSLGAAEIIGRDELSGQPRPLGKERWIAGVDCVGGTTLANVLSMTRYGGAVAACGLAASMDLPTSVAPFILRGVRLLGVDSVMAPLGKRKSAWARIATDLEPRHFEAITQTITLEEVAEFAPKILAGQVRGRVVVSI